MDRFQELYMSYVGVLTGSKRNVFCARLFEALAMHAQMQMRMAWVNCSEPFELSRFENVQNVMQRLALAMKFTFNSKTNKAMGLSEELDCQVQLCMNQAHMLIFQMHPDMHKEALEFLHAEFDQGMAIPPARPVAKKGNANEICFETGPLHHEDYTAPSSWSTSMGSAFVPLTL